MSKTITSALQNVLESESQEIAIFVKVTRTDSTVLGFTSYDTDVTYDSNTYYANGFRGSNIQYNDNATVDTMDVIGVIDNVVVDIDDLRNGVYDNAEIEIFLMDMSGSAPGDILKLKKGNLGQVQIKNRQYQAEVRGLVHRLQQTLVETYSPTCRAELGDIRCGVTLATYTETGTVTSVTDKKTFEDTGRTEANDYWNNGLLTWTSGNNNGVQMEVKLFSYDEFELLMPMNNDIEVGDTYSVVIGCDKTTGTCKNTFNNLVNFRGEPFIPGMDKVFVYGGQ